jgi:hypothetical protein
MLEMPGALVASYLTFPPAGPKTAAKINVQAVMRMNEFLHFPGAIWNFTLLVLIPRSQPRSYARHRSIAHGL